MKTLNPCKRVALLLAIAVLALSPSLWAQPTGAFEIYLADTKTGEAVQLTDNPEIGFFNASFSNNGKWIAADAVYPADQALVLIDLKTGEFITQIWGGNDASWSPNGNILAFDGLVYWYPHLLTMVPYEETFEFVRAWGIDPEWSPNSQRLVFTDFWTGYLGTVDVLTGEETFVADFGVNPSWSPNGNYIVYSDWNSLFKIEVNNAGEPVGAPVQLTFDGPDVYNSQPTWSNNSQYIVFHSNRGGADFDIWIMDADGGEPTLFSGFPETGDYDPCYSKNGQWVAFSSAGPNFAPVSAGKIAPEAIALQQNYPNPFADATTIRFELNEPAAVSLQIFDAQGALVATLASGEYDAGSYIMEWDGTGANGQVLPAGIYTYTLVTGDVMLTKRMIRIVK